jgi:hypothetical protein
MCAGILMLLPLLRKEKKEATADWMEIYEESEGGMEVFNVAKDYLMAQLRKQGFDTHSILRQSGEGTYTVGPYPRNPAPGSQRTLFKFTDPGA